MFIRYRSALLAGLAAASLLTVAGCSKKAAAVVNGKPIPRDRYYQTLERAAGAQLLTQLIAEELVLQEAAKQNLTPTDADVERRYLEVQKNNPTVLQGLSEEEARRQIRISEAVKSLAFKGVKVTEDEIKKAFEEHKEEFDQPEAVTIKRAVFKTAEEAKLARETLLEKGVEFSVILDKSIDMEAVRQNGGALPALFRNKDKSIVFAQVNPSTGQPYPAETLLGVGVAEILFSKKAKDVTEVLPCPAPQGFQVIQVQEHREAKTGSYAEWKDAIKENLLLRKRFENEKNLPANTDPLAWYQGQLVSSLRKQANIQVNIETLKDLPERHDMWQR